MCLFFCRLIPISPVDTNYLLGVALLYTLAYFSRSLKDAHSISLKNMSLATRIHPTDIVNQLLHDNLLVMKDENYFFRTWVGY